MKKITASLIKRGINMLIRSGLTVELLKMHLEVWGMASNSIIINSSNSNSLKDNNMLKQEDWDMEAEKNQIIELRRKVEESKWSVVTKGQEKELSQNNKL